MKPRIKCPHCPGYVGPLRGGLREDYYGRERLCGSCGTIWRMPKDTYAIVIGVAVVTFCAGLAAFYHWLWTDAADLCCAVWLLLWLTLFWPIYYRGLWQFRVKRYDT